jgi:hypothetical protein
MGQKVSFATVNWKDRPNKPANVSQTEWDAEDSSCFSGFPFPVYFAKKWTGEYSKPLDVYQQELQDILTPGAFPLGYNDIAYPVEIQAGWKEYDSTSAPGLPKFIYPDVVVPENAPAGCKVGSKIRPLIHDGGPYLGPFSREDVTRLWWSGRSPRVQNIGSTSGSINASHSLNMISSTVTASSSSSASDSNLPNINPNNDNSEVTAKILSLRIPNRYTSQIEDTQTSFDNVGVRYEVSDPDVGIFEGGDQWYEGYNSVDTNSTSVSTGAMVFYNDIVCDIDNPNDFYIKFRAYASVSTWVAASAISSESYEGGQDKDSKSKTIGVSTNSLNARGEIVPGHTYDVHLCAYDSYQDCNSQYKIAYTYPDGRNIYTHEFNLNNLGSAKAMVVKKGSGKFIQFQCQDRGPFIEESCIIGYPSGSPSISTSSSQSISINATFNFFDEKSVNFKMLGYSSESGAQVLDNYYNELQSSSTVSASMDPVNFHIKEYYEYDDGNGNPIYDKTTGAILRDPVTGEEV